VYAAPEFPVYRTRDGVTTGYASLKEAVRDGDGYLILDDDDVLKLNADITIEEGIDFENKKFTIDLNGHTLNGKFTDYEYVFNSSTSNWEQDPTKPFDNYHTLSMQGNVTIKNGTLSVYIDNYSAGFTSTLTLINTTLNGCEFQWMANGLVSLEKSVINLKSKDGFGHFTVENIAIDANSTVKLTGFNMFGYAAHVQGGLKSLVHRITLPKGYMFKKPYSDLNIAIVKESEPENVADMTGITFEIKGSATPTACSEYKYYLVNKSDGTDYDYCCKLCYDADATHSIRWNRDSENPAFNCPNYVLADDNSYYEFLNNVVWNPDFKFNAEQVSYSRTMKNQWGTIVLPFDVNVDSNKPYDFYEISSVEDEELVLEKITGTLSAGTPALIRIYSNEVNGKTYNLNITAANSTVKATGDLKQTTGSLSLVGAYDYKDITAENGYIISNNAFWNIQTVKGEDKVYCSPFRAYISTTSASGARLRIGEVEDESTGIAALDALNSSDAEYYDINGRRLNDLQKGMNIIKVNGKVTKVMIK